MKRVAFFLFTLSICISSYSQKADTLTNEMVIKLYKAGFNKDVLKSKIQASITNFDMSIDGMMALKKAGIPDEIINFMLSAPANTNPAIVIQSTVTTQSATTTSLNLSSGIYYKNEAGEYLEIEPSILTSTKSNAAAQLLISSLINAKTKATLSGKQSSFEIPEAKPTLIFVFDTTNKSSLNMDNNMFFSTARSPKEFLLVELEINKNSREITVGKGNLVEQNFGIDDKYVVHFSTKKLSNGVYEVIPQSELKKGEYCIMFAQGIKQGQSNKVFDFSITKEKNKEDVKKDEKQKNKRGF